MPNPCFNNGTCTKTLINYRCQCPVGYTGVLCKTIVPLSPMTGPIVNSKVKVGPMVAGVTIGLLTTLVVIVTIIIVVILCIKRQLSELATVSISDISLLHVIIGYKGANPGDNPTYHVLHGDSPVHNSSTSEGLELSNTLYHQMSDTGTVELSLHNTLYESRDHAPSAVSEHHYEPVSHYYDTVTYNHTHQHSNINGSDHTSSSSHYEYAHI